MLVKVITYWSNRFKVAPETFGNQGTSFIPNLHLNHNRQIVTFKTKKHNFVFYPDVYSKMLSFSSISKSIDIEQLNLEFPALALKQQGTDYYFYWMSDTPVDKPTDNLRSLQLSDRIVLETLQQKVTCKERKLGDVALEHPIVIGWFFNNMLLSAGSLIFDENIADIGILTCPAARGKGLGKQVVRALIIEALKTNKLVQYTSMRKNLSSVALAESLGFHRFATETYWSINL